ncbi:MAG: diguanylate cyclase [Deltaproteobacteria bacterium]|nr:diguanylate cyclase [Deltaproteobacteria bacterium]MBW2361152.1 diguanylate cyclase [Deltaproteobacteria bacterium]
MNVRNIAAVLRGLRWRRIAGALKRPLDSLASRVALSVFGAALVTGLAVTWISTQSTEAFLRAKIDQKFPVILRNTAERCELWFSQREIDVATFARSATVVESLRGLARDSGSSRDELTRYLGYVLEQFPQYETLFLLERDGTSLMQAGTELTLPAVYRKRLASAAGARLERPYQIGGQRVQIVSARVNDAAGQPLASLHAVLRGSEVDAALRSEGLGPRSGVYVVDVSGEVIYRSTGAPHRERYAHDLPASTGAAEVADYQDATGARVVGTVLPFSRFGWRLVVEEPYDVAFAPVVDTSRNLLLINLGIVLVFVLIAFQMARSIVRPILALSAGALRIADGEIDVVIEAKASDGEIGVMLRAFNTMAERLRENQAALEGSRREVENANSQLLLQNRELQRVNEVFLQLSITDELTKLHNHRYFQEHLPREISRAVRFGESLCLILVDIDDFKVLNDRFGHAAGDAVLRKVGAVMNASVRDMDLLARYGGEEFALLAPQTDLAGAVVLAEKIRVAIGSACFEQIELEGPGEVHVTASFGVARFRGDAKAFFNDADRALYVAKDSGKDCVIVAEEE